ncbi:hypothetical protein AHAS_Ahas12G0165700 [Arachis hypogaea]
MMPTPGVPRSCTQQANKPSNTASHGDLVGKDKSHLMVPKILKVKELLLLLVTLAQVFPSLDMMVPNNEKYSYQNIDSRYLPSHCRRHHLSRSKVTLGKLLIELSFLLYTISCQHNLYYQNLPIH